MLNSKIHGPNSRLPRPVLKKIMIFISLKYFNYKNWKTWKVFCKMLQSQMFGRVVNMPLVLNKSGFWICLWFWICQSSFLNVPRFWICRFLNIPGYTWISPKYAWLYLNMSECVCICLNIPQYGWICLNLPEWLFFQRYL